MAGTAPELTFRSGLAGSGTGSFYRGLLSSYRPSLCRPLKRALGETPAKLLFRSVPGSAGCASGLQRGSDVSSGRAQRDHFSPYLPSLLLRRNPDRQGYRIDLRSQYPGGGCGRISFGSAADSTPGCPVEPVPHGRCGSGPGPVADPVPGEKDPADRENGPHRRPGAFFSPWSSSPATRSGKLQSKTALIMRSCFTVRVCRAR